MAKAKNTSIREEIADGLREVIEETGLTKGELAGRFGVHKTYLSRLLAGSINLTVDALDKMEKSVKTKILRRKVNS